MRLRRAIAQAETNVHAFQDQLHLYYAHHDDGRPVQDLRNDEGLQTMLRYHFKKRDLSIK